eukprot:PhF_6_TR32584/c0_g1_i1/m.48216
MKFRSHAVNRFPAATSKATAIGVALLLVLLIAPISALGAITTTPTSLISQMPFYVYSDDVTVTSVFLSSSSTCASGNTVAAAQSLSSPYYNTLFQLPSQTLLTLYVCQSIGGLSLRSLSF